MWILNKPWWKEQNIGIPECGRERCGKIFDYASSKIFATSPFASKIFASPTLCVYPFLSLHVTHFSRFCSYSILWGRDQVVFPQKFRCLFVIYIMKNPQIKYQNTPWTMCAVALSALSSTCDVAAQDLQWAVCSMGSRGVLLASRPPDPARPAPPVSPPRPGPPSRTLHPGNSWVVVPGPCTERWHATHHPRTSYILTCNLKTLISVKKERFIQSWNRARSGEVNFPQRTQKFRDSLSVILRT